MVAKVCTDTLTCTPSLNLNKYNTIHNLYTLGQAVKVKVLDPVKNVPLVMPYTSFVLDFVSASLSHLTKYWH